MYVYMCTQWYNGDDHRSHLAKNALCCLFAFKKRQIECKSV